MTRSLDVQKVHEKFERSAHDPNIDRRDSLSREAYKEANKLSGADQDLLTKKLVTDGILPKVVIDNGLVKDTKNLTSEKLKEMSLESGRSKFERKLLKELSAHPEAVKRAAEILKGKRDDPEYREKMSKAADTANAMRQMPKLLERNKKLGGSDKALTENDVDKLLQSKDLSDGEKRALNFIKKNWDDLKTRRDADGHGWSPFNSSKVSLESLRRNAKDEFGITNKQIDTARETQIQEKVTKNSRVEIRKGEGYWHAARRELSKDGHKPSNAEIAREMHRLQKLNKGRGMLHPGDRVKSSSDDDVRKEIARRMKATA